MSFIEERHTEADFSLKERLITAENITVKRDMDDFENSIPDSSRKTANDRHWDQKLTIKIHSHIKSEEDNLESHTKVNVFLKNHPFTAPNITVKRESGDFDIRTTANEVDRDLDQKSTIKLHSHVKSEEENIINSQNLISHEEVDIKSEDDLEESETQVSAIEKNTYQQNIKIVAADFAQPNTTVVLYTCKEQIKIYKCPDCPYQSLNKSYLKKHSIRHRKPDDIVWLRCTECPYKAKWKQHLERHAIVHNEKRQLVVQRGKDTTLKEFPEHELHSRGHSNDKFLKCPQCPYKTTILTSLNRHVRVHAKPDKLELYMCEHCPYKALQKCTVKQHMLTHYKDRPQKSTSTSTPLLQCTFCSYKTWRKSSFKQHQMMHQDDDDDPGWHKCPECPYKATTKALLLEHAKNHNAADQTDWLQCPECTYRTPRKDFLKAHQMLHNDIVELFHCYDCPYKTNMKRSLAFHVKMHLQTGPDQSC